MTSLIIIVAVGMFVASLVALGASVLVPTEETTATEDRLQQLASGKRGGAAEESKASLLVDNNEDGPAVMASLFGNMPGLHKILDQADVNISVSQLILLTAGCFGLGVASCVFTPLPVLLGPIIGAGLGCLPFLYVMWVRKKRIAKFGRQMPDALELLSRSLRAGHSLQAGFGLVGEETEAPLATEFKRCFEEQKFGIPLDESIEDMAERIPNMDLRFFATAVLLQRQTGGDLSEILDKIGHLIRQRLEIMGTIQALTGEGRMSGTVLLALPPVLFLIMLKLNYEYIMVLFSDDLGTYMIAGALVTQMIGALVIKKIITIKV
ncbi:MAG: type II secretion system F family protein [Planctomycetota bacterium]